MKWGEPWGGLWGDGPQNLRVTDLGLLAPTALLEWDEPSTTINLTYHVYVNGVFAGITRETRMVVPLKVAGRFYWEVFATNENTEGESRAAFVTERTGDRITLSWTPGAGAASFRISWDRGLGTIDTQLGTTTGSSFQTDRLPNGTHKFRVDSLDAAGNVLTSSLILTHSVSRPPDPPTGVTVDAHESGGTWYLDVAWTAGASSVTGHRVYHNGGSGPIDYSAPAATVADPTAALAIPLAGAPTGDWEVVVRAYDGSFEEDNGNAARASWAETIDDPTGALQSRPPATPRNLLATAIAGGKIRLRCDYPVMGAQRSGASIRFFHNGGSGAIDYTTAVVTEALPTHTAGSPVILAVDVETAALTDGVEYLFAARAVADGIESASSNEISATADDTAPADITGLSAAASV